MTTTTTTSCSSSTLLLLVSDCVSFANPSITCCNFPSFSFSPSWRTTTSKQATTFLPLFSSNKKVSIHFCNFVSYLYSTCIFYNGLSFIFLNSPFSNSEFLFVYIVGMGLLFVELNSLFQFTIHDQYFSFEIMYNGCLCISYFFLYCINIIINFYFFYVHLLHICSTPCHLLVSPLTLL